MSNWNGKATGIGFWNKDSGNLCSYHKGLSKADVEFFQELKEGDRLIIYSQEDAENKNRPNRRQNQDEPTSEEGGI